MSAPFTCRTHDIERCSACPTTDIEKMATASSDSGFLQNSGPLISQLGGLAKHKGYECVHSLYRECGQRYAALTLMDLPFSREHPHAYEIGDELSAWPWFLVYGCVLQDVVHGHRVQREQTLVPLQPCQLQHA